MKSSLRKSLVKRHQMTARVAVLLRQRFNRALLDCQQDHSLMRAGFAFDLDDLVCSMVLRFVEMPHDARVAFLLDFLPRLQVLYDESAAFDAALELPSAPPAGAQKKPGAVVPAPGPAPVNHKGHGATKSSALPAVPEPKKRRG